MAVSGRRGPGRQKYPQPESGGSFAYGRGGHGVWRNAQPGRHGSWKGRTVLVSRSMELKGSSGMHHAAGAEGSSQVANGPLRRCVARRGQEGDLAARRHPSCHARRECLCFVKPEHDERATLIEALVGSGRVLHTGGMAAISGQQVRRRFVATVPPRRPLGQAAGAALRSGWYGSSAGRFSVPPVRRTSGIPSSSSLGRTGEGVEPRGSTSAMPAGGSDQSDAAEAANQPGASDDPHPEVASATVVLAGLGYGEQGDGAGLSSGGNVERAEEDEPGLEACASGDEPGRLGQLTSETMLEMGENSAAMARSARLVTEHGWSAQTSRTRDSQWGTWQRFCSADNWDPLPVTEAHMVAFVGWICEEREKGRRKIGVSSVPQYLSSVRQRQLEELGLPVPSFPMVPLMIREYTKWEEEAQPLQDVRIGLSAEQMHKLWEMGMNATHKSIVRDAAMCLFAYCFNGLRESSVASMRVQDVSFTDQSMICRLCVVKGRQASRVPLVGFTVHNDLSPWHKKSSALDLWRRWSGMRVTHPRFFGLAGEPALWKQGELSGALQRALGLCRLCTPTGGRYSSHSIRIGAHTGQVLLGIPLEVRLSRFGWGNGYGLFRPDDCSNRLVGVGIVVR